MNGRTYERASSPASREVRGPENSYPGQPEWQRGPKLANKQKEKGSSGKVRQKWREGLFMALVIRNDPRSQGGDLY